MNPFYLILAIVIIAAIIVIPFFNKGLPFMSKVFVSLIYFVGQVTLIGFLRNVHFKATWIKAFTMINFGVFPLIILFYLILIIYGIAKRKRKNE